MNGWHKARGKVPVQLAFVGLPLIMAGCGAPAAFLWATLAIDVATVASTGKTPGEHMLSAAVQQDCGVRRLVTEGNLCVPVEVAADPYGIDLLLYN